MTGLLDGEEMHFIVNHWPSRSGGEKKSSPFREAAGRLDRKIMDSIYTKYETNIRQHLTDIPEKYIKKHLRNRGFEEKLIIRFLN